MIGLFINTKVWSISDGESNLTFLDHILEGLCVVLAVVQLLVSNFAAEDLNRVVQGPLSSWPLAMWAPVTTLFLLLICYGFSASVFHL